MLRGGAASFQVKLDTTKVGVYNGVISFKTNDADEGAFDFAISGAVIEPEIDVSGNGVSIKDGSKKAALTNHTLFDAGIGLGDAPAVRSFTISNAVGAADLTISSADLVGTGFTLLTDLTGTVLQGGQSVNFNVSIDTAIAGTRSATIRINNNDANEGVYDFVVTGTVGPRNVVGGDGVDDVFIGNADPERYDGKGGNDTVSYAGPGAVVASLTSPKKNAGLAAGDTYASVENLVGSSSNDRLTGDAANNILEGGPGADKLDGGAGNNTASYANADTGVTADLLKASNNLGEAAGDTYKKIQNLFGSGFDDTLTGNKLDNVITGNVGVDTLTGGTGVDTFMFNAAQDGGATGDLITDFVSGTDHVGILRSGFAIQQGVDVGAVGALDFAAHYFVTAPGTSGADPSGVFATEAGHGQFLFNQTTHQLWWDSDGTGGQVALLLATFQNNANLLPTDFDLL